MLDYTVIAAILAALGGSGGGIYIGNAQRSELRRKIELLAEKARRKHLLEGCFRLRALSGGQPLTLSKGPIPLIWSGSAAAGIGPTCLQPLEASLLSNIIGPIFIIEPDDLISLPNCKRRIPLAFHNRLIVPQYRALGGGWGGADVRYVYSEEGRALWREDQQPHEERFLSAVRHQDEPPFLLVIISPGPSGAMAWALLRAYAAEHPNVPIYVIFVLDKDPKRRQLHVGQLLDLYGQDDLVKLFIINDNARGVQDEYDQAIGAFLLCVLQGPWLELTPKAGWNSLGDLWRLYGHRVATLRFVPTRLGVDYLEPYKDQLPPVWYTNGVHARTQLRLSLRMVLDDLWRQSLPLPPANEPWLVGVASSIWPGPDLLQLRQSLGAVSLQPHNGTLLMGSMDAPLTSSTPDVDALTVALVPIEEGLDAVRKLAEGTIQPGPEFQPTQSLVPTSISNGGNNGHETSAERTGAGATEPLYERS